MHRVLPVHEQGAALVTVVFRGARRDIGGPDGGALRLQVHFPLEVVLPGEADEGLDVLGQDGLRGTLGDPPHHEGAGAEVVRPDPRGVLAEALVGTAGEVVPSGRVPPAAEQCHSGHQDGGDAPDRRPPPSIPRFLHQIPSVRAQEAILRGSAAGWRRWDTAGVRFFNTSVPVVPARH